MNTIIKRKSSLSPKIERFLSTHFPNTTALEWNDWHWQLKHRIQTPKQLASFFSLTNDEIDAFSKINNRLPFSITPYYINLIDPNNLLDALRRSVVPSVQEFNIAPEELVDPLGEEKSSPVPFIVHRYPNRILLLVSDCCATCCRYCTRARLIKKIKNKMPLRNLEPAFQYIEKNKQIEDVLISGGDPFMLSTVQLEKILKRLHSIPHLKYIRIGTKVPVVLPQRINSRLVNMLKKYPPLLINIHFIHPNELTEETKEACQKLADVGIMLGSQTVLLKGINDNISTLRDLMMGLLSIKVRPYYLLQCDLIVGSKHFRTPIQKGLDIIKGLRGFISGCAIPSYIIDLPGGGGKISLLPDYISNQDGNNLTFFNYMGEKYCYPKE